jgi:hypothetical protein
MGVGAPYPVRVPRTEGPWQYLHLSFEYYLSGRFAAINQFHIAPNLMHHAAELLIKYTLLKDVSAPQQSDAARNLAEMHRHDLKGLWTAYKPRVAPADLSRFDPVITDLHRWERLRYGGFPSGVSVTMIFDRSSTGGPRKAGGAGPQDVYVFALQEVDGLYAAMIVASNINPGYLGLRYHSLPAVREWYEQENQHILGNLFGS